MKSACITPSHCVSCAAIFLIASGLAAAQSAGTFNITGSMAAARYFHTATLLTNGKVLIAGGFGQGLNALASAELYDPATGAFTPTGAMTTARGLHNATLLADGRVLIAGGRNNQNASDLGSAELYDPDTGTFASTPDMVRLMAGWRAAPLLGNSKVLLTGSGFAAQLYDPASGTFTSTDLSGGPPPQGYTSTATLLAEGRVLITGFSNTGSIDGTLLRSELYDPVNGAFSPTDPHSQDLQTATLLTNGKVLFEGGDCDPDTSAELYNPLTGTFSATGSTLTERRFTSTATLLPDGTVLVAGGDVPGGVSLASAELYDPSPGTFSPAGNMTVPRQTHTATLLPDGTVLMAGGSSPTFRDTTDSAEIYTPNLLVPAPVLFSMSGDGQGQGAIWHATTGSIASPNSPASSGEVLAMYTTSLTDGSVIPPQVAVGGRLAEILYFGSAPGYPGYYQVNFRVPNSFAPGSNVPVRLSYLNRPSNEVSIAVQ
jgi:uncharacterized protein (TIGR03437 family)